MFGLSKKRDCVLGIFLVGSNKTFAAGKMESDLYKNADYKHYRTLVNIKRSEYEVDKGSFEWFLDDDIIEKVKNLNKDLHKTFSEVARVRLGKDYKGFGEDLVDSLTAAIMLVYSAIQDELKTTKPGALSIVVKVPKYVTMLLDKEGRKHNSVNWLIDNNSFVHSIHEVFGERASHNGYKGNVITLLRWTEM